MNEIQTSAAPAKRLDSLAQNVALLLVFLLPLVFMPTFLVPFVYSKVLLVAAISLLPLVIWSVYRFRAGSFMFPNGYVLWSALMLPVVYFVSALLSGNVGNSMLGAGYENGTFVFMLLLVSVFVATSLIFTSVSSISKAFLVVGSSFTVLALVQVVRLLFGAQNILPSVFSSNVTTTVLGSWNDLAVFSGFIVIISLVAITYAKHTLFMRALTYTNLLLAMFLLVVVNLKVIWVLLALLSMVLFVYFVTSKKVNQLPDSSDVKKKKLEQIMQIGAPVAVFAVSVLFVFMGTFFGPKISDSLGVKFVDVRPSWEGTTEVVKKTYSDGSTLFGTGPNTFTAAWLKHKPDGVNSTPFWSADFRSGIGIVPTAFVTVGLIGGLLWLLFGASIVYIASRVLWARMPNDATRFVAFSAVGAAVYFLVLLVMYVPQTIMLSFAFFFSGILLAVARNLNVVKTRRISLDESQVMRFTIMLTFVTTMLAVTTVSAAVFQRVLVSSYLERSTRAAQDSDLDRATLLAKRAQKFNVFGMFGKDDRPSSLLAQIGIVNLQKVLQTDKTVEGYKERLQAAVSAVIVPAKKALAVDASNYSNHLFLGNVYEQLTALGIEGAYDAAVASYSAAAEISPKNPSIPLRKARAAFTNGKNKEAITYAREALKLKRNYADAYYLLSQIAIKDGDAEQAIIATESAAILAPGNAGILFQLGVLQNSTAKYNEAIVTLNKAVALNPTYANALYYLGLSYAQIGEDRAALNAFKRVETLNPKNEDVKKIIASLEAKISRPAGEGTPVSEVK